MARHAATRGQDAPRGRHPAQVLGRGLDPHQDHALAACRPRLGVVGVKGDPAGRGAGAGSKSTREETARGAGRLLGLQVERWPEQLLDAVGLDAAERLVAGDEPFAHHVERDPDCRQRRPLPDPALEHVERALLDRELDVHDVAVVALEDAADLHELGVELGGLALEGRDRQRRAHAGDDVLALGIHQELTVEDVLARRRVAREGDSGAGIGPRVAEHHRLHVHRGAPGVRDGVQPPVDHRPLVHPGPEDGADRTPELLLRVLRKRDAPSRADQRLEFGHQLPQCIGVEVGVELDATGPLLLLEHDLERVALRLALGLETQHDVAVHLDEPPVAVVGEARIRRLARQAGDRLVVQAEVQDGVHHAGHRGARARADGHEERLLRVAKTPADRFLDARERSPCLLLQARRIAAAAGVVIGADLGRDREAGRHRQPEARHLGEVRALAAEERLHVGTAVGTLRAEPVDVPPRARGARRRPRRSSLRSCHRILLWGSSRSSRAAPRPRGPRRCGPATSHRGRGA